MSPKRDVVDYLRDILEYSEKAQNFVKNLNFNSFRKNEEKMFAVVRALEVVGEAARQIPPRMRSRYPTVPWNEVTGMRNKLSHEYFGVDVEVVWRTLHVDLPVLYDTVQQILKEIE